MRFNIFFDTTPRRLVIAGLYRPIAISLKGGVFRQASLSMLAAQLAKEPSSFQKVVQVRFPLIPFIQSDHF